MGKNPTDRPGAAARRSADRFGRRAERLCALLLRLKGYAILARRYRGPGGEIDIVARRGRTIAIVEVKARPDRDTALAALGAAQRRRLQRAALAWLAAHAEPGRAGAEVVLRFDVMLVGAWRWPSHIENAWQADAWSRDPG